MIGLTRAPIAAKATTRPQPCWRAGTAVSGLTWLQNLHFRSSSFPADCSCQRARHFAWAWRGHLQGLCKGSLPLSSSSPRQIQQTLSRAWSMFQTTVSKAIQRLCKVLKKIAGIAKVVAPLLHAVRITPGKGPTTQPPSTGMW
jgi:hypothetical protein